MSSTDKAFRMLQKHGFAATGMRVENLAHILEELSIYMVGKICFKLTRHGSGKNRMESSDRARYIGSITVDGQKKEIWAVW